MSYKETEQNWWCEKKKEIFHFIVQLEEVAEIKNP